MFNTELKIFLLSDKKLHSNYFCPNSNNFVIIKFSISIHVEEKYD